MEVEINFNKSAQENANEYYNKSKKMFTKIEGAKKAIKELKDQLDKLEKIKNKEMEKAKNTKLIVKKEWYENFHWFFTSYGNLVIGGRDAGQNELINSKYFEDNDLFFHANIFGASLVVLKNGVFSNKEEKEEVAQFSGSYSSAWKEGLTSIDVYSVKRNQVSKSTNKGSLGRGSFLITGEREWYNVSLSLVATIIENKDVKKFNIMPKLCYDRLNKDNSSNNKYAVIEIGDEEKSTAAKKLAKFFNIEVDEAMKQLPNGGFKIILNLK
ncbi:MAG: NFACT RNA binding domain-containing protein [Candidatus Micrarchaeia archaeon]